MLTRLDVVWFCHGFLIRRGMIAMRRRHFKGSVPKPGHSKDTYGLPVGYCNHDKHPGLMTIRLIRANRCLSKKCKRLVLFKYEPQEDINK